MPEMIKRNEYFDISKRMMAYSMSRSQKEAPVVVTSCEPDITALWEEFQNLRKEVDYPLSFNTVILKIVCEAIKAAPVVNSHVVYDHTSASGRIEYKKNIDIAMATVIKNRQMTFTLKVRNMENMNLRDISNAVRDLVERAENTNMDIPLGEYGYDQTVEALKKMQFKVFFSRLFASEFGKGKLKKISPEEMKKYKEGLKKGTVITKDEVGEGTICVTNWGSISKGVEIECRNVPIIPPSVVSTVIGSVKEKQLATVKDGEMLVENKKYLPISIGWDHRIGGLNDVMPYIRRLDELCSSPELLRSWM